MDVNVCFEKWLNILRIKNQWDVKLEMISDPEFKKTGDFKIDCDDRKAILLLNERNPRYSNCEEGSKAFDFAYAQFMTSLEITVEELTKCFLMQYGDNKELSYGRCKDMKSFDELFDGLKPLK